MNRHIHASNLSSAASVVVSPGRASSGERRVPSGCSNPATLNRPDTTMGRALATRAMVLADTLMTDQPSAVGLFDLTTPETPLPPPHVREAAKAALDRGETHYTSRPGVPQLRAALARHSAREGFPATPDTVVVTNGGAEALYIALQQTLAPGDRILVAEPIAPNIIAMIRFIGGEPVSLPTDAASGFAPDLESRASVDATALLLASPSPISGVAIPPDDLQRLIAAAVGRDLDVILDRSLVTALYDPAAVFADPDLSAKVTTIGSFSTGHGLGGWRVGWFAAPETRIKGLRELKQAMSICTTAVSQFAALAALEGPDDWLAERRRTFAARRDAATATLGAAGFGIVEPDAYSPLLIDARQLDPDDRRAAERLAEHGVVVEPASPYGETLAGYVRIDLAAAELALGDGLERVARLGKGQGQA